MTRRELLVRLGALALLVLPVALGLMWLLSVLPGSSPAPQTWEPAADPARQTVPHLAQLPWKRDAATVLPATVAAAQLPWRRTAERIDAITVAAAQVPWRRDAGRPAQVWVATAVVPFH